MNSKKFTEKLRRQNSWEDISTFLSEDKEGTGVVSLEKRKRNRDQYCIEVYKWKGKTDGLKRQEPSGEFLQSSSSSNGKRSGSIVKTNDYDKSTSKCVDVGESSHIMKRIRFNPPEVKVVDVESKNVSIEKHRSFFQDSDEDSMFMMSLVPSLKAIHPNFKLKAKMEIIKLFDQFPKNEIKPSGNNLRTDDGSNETREINYVDIVDSPVSIQSYESCSTDDDDDDDD